MAEDTDVDPRDDIARALDDKVQAERFPVMEVAITLIMLAAILGLAWLMGEGF